MTTTKPRTVPTVGGVLDPNYVEPPAPPRNPRSEPAPIAQRFVDAANALSVGHNNDVEPFIMELASATTAYIANIEARIAAAGELRTHKAGLEERRTFLLDFGVKIQAVGDDVKKPAQLIAPRIDGKSVDIREAQLAVMCSEDELYVLHHGAILAWEAAMDAAVGRADACKELCRSIRLVIQALMPGELTAETTSTYEGQA